MNNTTKLAKFIGSPFSLIIHTLIFGAIFALKLFGIATEQLLFILATVISLEAIYLVILVQTIVNKNSKRLSVVQEKIEQMQMEEEESYKLMMNVLHTSHQMKAIQHDLDILRKSGILKSSSNGHQKRAHA